MNVILLIIAIVILIPITITIIYSVVMLKKKKFVPTLELEHLKSYINDKQIKELETMINGAIKGSNGWILLSAFFLSLYYLLNFWSISFSILNLFLLASSKDLSISTEHLNFFILSFSALSAVFSFTDIWLNTKEKSEVFHKNWFNTSLIIKKYIIDIQTTTTLIDFQNISKTFLEDIQTVIDETKFL